MPMPIVESDTAVNRWLRKPVLESRLLDDMELTNHWAHHGHGSLSLAADRARDGKQSLLLTSPTIPDKPLKASGRPFGEAVARRAFAQEDWTRFNRVSFHVFPDLPGFKVVSMLVRLSNAGSERLSYTAGPMNFFLLNNGQWNQVVWEIPHLARDKVTGLDFVYRLQGNEPGATNVVRFYLDHLELQRVDADHFEGWSVAPGRIACSGSGYPVEGSKIALATGLKESTFSVIVQDTGREVTKPVRTSKTTLGEFQVLDFSDVVEPGTYRLQAGTISTPPFRIHPEVWRDSIWKTLNFFYCERCGDAIPGIHAACHQDWQVVHGGQRIVINGGWHDAGDLSQGLVNTAEAAYAMFDLAEQLRQTSRLSPPVVTTNNRREARTDTEPAGQPGTGRTPLPASDAALSQRLLEEACWGLDWLLKTRFGDGYRVTWATMDYWTDGKVGNADDTLGGVGNGAFDNFLAAATEARAARVLKDSHGALPEKAVKAAREDWQFATEKIRTPNLELASAGAQASLELFLATREQPYADKAFELANIIVRCQQREYPDWQVPLTGFFYTSTNRDRILHYFHRAHEQAPVVALAGLCKAFPAHADWMKWYSAVVLYAEYLKRLARFNTPYAVFPASVYRVDERPDQVARGVQLGERHYLRRFPVWDDFRGHFGVLLSQTKALATAARLRGDPAAADLCHRQLEWVTGLNPFVQSTMFGEGNNYAPQYTAMSGDMVGSLPVGIQTRGPEDTPYWPFSNCYNYKEVWVHPSARWLAVLRDLAEAPLSLTGTNLIRSVSLDLKEDGRATVRVVAQGAGTHEFCLRANNLVASQTTHRVRLTPNQPQELVWNGQLASVKEPVVAVITPDNQAQERRDVFTSLK